ncbi:MAG: cupin domain-containing protein [Acidimicrobiales bacterium]
MPTEPAADLGGRAGGSAGLGGLDRGALVGERLRRRRLDLGIGVRELARRVDCSPSLISQVERGKVAPSVSTLWAMVTALGVSMDSLFDSPGEAEATDPAAGRGEGAANGPARRPPRVPVAGAGTEVPAAPDAAAGGGGRVGAAALPGPVLRSEERPTITLQRGVRWARLTPRADLEVEFLEVCYEPGAGIPEAEHAIQHNGREYAVVVEGTLSVQIGFEQHVLRAGDSMTFESTVPHRFWNSGEIPARAVWFVLNRSQ